MEKCVDSENPKTQYDSSKSPETWTSLHPRNSRNNEQKNKLKKLDKIPRARKKIAAENRSVGRSDPGKRIANFKRDKSVREENQRVTQLNVLKSRVTPVRCSVQNSTKILHRNVPDRIGKYANSSARTETKSLLGDCSPVANSSNDCLQEEGTKSTDDGSLKDCPDTKLNMIGNECLSNEESVDLGNSIESDSGSKNIFEKIFDDCLVSTSVVKDASSQEMLNLEADDESVAVSPKTVEKYTRLLENFENFKKDDARMIDNKRKPANRERLQKSSSAPVKMKDHGKYASRKKIRHVCGYCHKIFKSNGKLNSHVYSHTGERPFDCNNCGKAFSSKFKLVRHLLIHSEVRKFICHICDRTFLRNDHLKNHYKVHDPQKKMYKCPKENCDKEYSSTMSYKKHMAYHSVEDGDFKCLICNVKFEAKEEILYHLKSHSNSRLFKSQTDKKFKCDFCDRLFLTRKDVTRHLVVHTGERDFLCQFCPQRFGRKDHLVRHIKKSHLKDGTKTEIKQLIEEKKEEVKDDAKTTPAAADSPPTQSSDSKEDKEEEEKAKEEDPNEKTHIVITVKSPAQKKKKKPSDSAGKGKSFRKRDSSVPNKKQVPLSKGNNSTTQIVLQNIPNVFIIPNNSIILLRNQPDSMCNGSNAAEASESSINSSSTSGSSISNDNSSSSAANNNVNTVNSSENVSTPVSQDRYQFFEEYPPVQGQMPIPITQDVTPPLETNYSFNLNYNYMLQPPQYPVSYLYNDNYVNYQPDVTYGYQLDAINFDMLSQNDPKRMDMVPEGGFLASPGIILDGDLQRKVGIVKPMMMGNQYMVDKNLFEGNSENLIMNNAILTEFKVDEPVIVDNDGGILNNIFAQGVADATGNELLRNVLLSETPILSPLPGFSQIFHNSNAN